MNYRDRALQTTGWRRLDSLSAFQPKPPAQRNEHTQAPRTAQPIALAPAPVTRSVTTTTVKPAPTNHAASHMLARSAKDRTQPWNVCPETKTRSHSAKPMHTPLSIGTWIPSDTRGASVSEARETSTRVSVQIHWHLPTKHHERRTSTWNGVELLAARERLPTQNGRVQVE